MRKLIAIAVIAIAAAGSPSAIVQSSSAVVGGTLTSVQSAPWTVYVKQAVGSSTAVCTGTIVDSLHVLTAAHCAFDPSGTTALPSALSIRAGISNFSSPAASDAEQDRGVSSYRVHPNYTWKSTISADDVALLALSAPLDLTGTAVQAAHLPAAAGAFPTGGTAVVAAFGRESASSSPDGSLNAMTATVDEQGNCGSNTNEVVLENNAIALCAAASSSTPCNGDSGAGLVTTDASHTVIGVVSGGAPGCVLGSHGVYTYVAAPEILSFIQGNDQPPVAPRLTDATYLDLFGDPPLRVGSTLKCESGNWTGTPKLDYAFLDSKSGRILKQGSPTFVLAAGDAGDTIACRVSATNAGGTSILTTDSTMAVGLPRLDIERVTAVSAVRGKTVKVQVWIDPPDGINGKFSVCLTPKSRVALTACASRRGQGGGRFSLTVGLRIKQTAPLGRGAVAITAVAGPAHAKSSTTLRVSRT